MKNHKLSTPAKGSMTPRFRLISPVQTPKGKGGTQTPVKNNKLRYSTSGIKATQPEKSAIWSPVEVSSWDIAKPQIKISLDLPLTDRQLTSVHPSATTRDSNRLSGTTIENLLPAAATRASATTRLSEISLQNLPLPPAEREVVKAQQTAQRRKRFQRAFSNKFNCLIDKNLGTPNNFVGKQAQDLLKKYETKKEPDLTSKTQLLNTDLDLYDGNHTKLKTPHQRSTTANKEGSKQLFQAMRQYQAMSQSLRAVVSVDGEKHTQLYHGQKHCLDMFPDTNFYFKVKVAGMPSPLKIQLVPQGNQEMIGRRKNDTSRAINLTVFYGNTYAYNEPKETGHHQKFVNPGAFIHIDAQPPGSEFFHGHDWAYLGLVSLTGCDIQICPKVTESVNRQRRPNPLLFDTQDHNQQHKTIVDEPPKPPQHLIQKNQTIASHFQRYHKLHSQNKKQDSEQKQILFAARKQVIDQEERKYKQFLVAKSDIMKQKKQQIQAQVQKRQNNKHISQTWINLNNTLQILKQVYKVYADRKHQHVQQQKRLRAHYLFLMCWNKFLTNISCNTHKALAIRRVKYCCNMFTRVRQSETENKATQILYSTLCRAHTTSVVIDFFAMTYKHIVACQKKIRHRTKVRETRRQFLVDIMSNNISVFSDDFTKNCKTVQAAQRLQLLSKLKGKLPELVKILQNFCAIRERIAFHKKKIQVLKTHRNDDEEVQQYKNKVKKDEVTEQKMLKSLFECEMSQKLRLHQFYCPPNSKWNSMIRLAADRQASKNMMVKTVADTSFFANIQILQDNDYQAVQKLRDIKRGLGVNLVKQIANQNYVQ